MSNTKEVNVATSSGKYLFPSGEENPSWKGGRTVASNGYVLIRIPGHVHADVRGYVYEHRFIASEKLGRPLKKGEVVHHIDGNKTNNSPENLQIVKSIAEHSMNHRTKGKRLRNPEEKNRTVTCACGCGKSLMLFDPSGRPRKFISGHNLHGEVKHGHQY